MTNKKILSFFILFLFSFSITYSQSKSYSVEDVPEIMKVFFDYHIENKKMNPILAKRMVKFYIEQFDPEKIYLMENEIQEYLSLSDKDANELSKKIIKGDFSYFSSIDSLFENAISRNRKMREEIEKDLIENDNYEDSFSRNEGRGKTQKSLFKSIKKKICHFFSFHHKRMIKNTKERRKKIIQLFERRVIKKENLYVSNNEPKKVIQILKAFAKSLDAHTAIFSEEEAFEMRMSLEKQFEGIGVVLTEGIDGIIISDLVKNGPAYKSGKIEKEDIIIEINGTSIKDLDFDKVLNMMKAKEKITLGLIRISSVQDLDKLKPITRVSLKAAPVVIDEERLSYTSEPYGDSIIGKLTLNFFYENANGITAEKDILAAIEKLQKKGNLKGLILDLRENAGGFLNQAVKVSGVFVSNGVIVVSKYSGGAIRYLRTMGSKKAFSGPLIVLTSKLSASASEIVAQSLQDYGVALIVGDRRTFGKGSIQFQTVTSENADLFFKVTVGKYYTVSGKSTQIKGVLADIVVPSFFSPYPYGEKYLDNPLSNDSIHPSFWDSLEDIGGREREWMLANYIPNLQKEISVWKKMLPILKKNSNYRLKNDPNFKLFLKKMESIRLSLEDKKIMKDKNKDNYGVEDLQMQEAVNIIKDMIFLKDFSNKQ